jgi:hypothetical protein
MAYTKRDIVSMAFEEIGLSAYVFDLQPQQLEGALRRLDGMMAVWSSKGIKTSYPIPAGFGDSDLDQLSNLTAEQVEAAAINLAVAIAPSYGKTVSPDTKALARRSYIEVLRVSSQSIEVQLNSTSIPSGAGNKGWRYYNDPFLRSPSATTPNLDIPDFNYDFGNLIAGDTYSGVSFELELQSGSPVDLTDAEIRATFKYGGIDGAVALSFQVGSGITITDAVNGAFQIEPFVVPEAVGVYYADVEVTFPDGTRKTYITAVMRVQEQVSK